MEETWVRSLGWKDPLEESTATHSSVLTWRIPLDRGAQRSLLIYSLISKGNSQAMADCMILEPRRRFQTRVIDVRVSHIMVRTEDG